MINEKKRHNILVVDDEDMILDLICGVFPPGQYQSFRAGCGRDALSILESQPIDLAILDFSLPDMCGADLFQQIRAGNSQLPVIFLTGHRNLETAVALMKSGARDYLTKPFVTEELSSRVSRILRPDIDRISPPSPGGDAGVRQPIEYVFGTSEAMRVVEAHIQNLPRYPDVTVLITGPTGTGKSAVARRIHELSCGDREPFMEIDCSTIPRELCESELFGHEKGAFTGAHRARAGLFEAAGHGTAFLDEIGELDLPLQAKLLRVLEARRFKRVGGHADLPMAARVIAATNRSLPELVAAGRFREDLFFRLNVFELWMPPLKDRGNDRFTLAQHFLKYLAAHYNRNITGFTPEALTYIQHNDFPGNIRELRNLIERGVINSTSEFVHLPAGSTRSCPLIPRVDNVIGFPKFDLQKQSVKGAGAEMKSFSLAEVEQNRLQEALIAANYNKSKAAKLVGLSRTAFHRRLKKYAQIHDAGATQVEVG